MLRGRPNVPEHLKIVQGTQRKGRQKTAPKNKPGVPACPTWLAADAKREWKWIVQRVAPELLQQADKAVLSSYCDALGKIIQWERDVKKEGRMVEHVGSNGQRNMIVNPKLHQIEQLWKRLEKALSHLGFSPASRARLHVPSKDAGNSEIRKFLAQRPS